MASQQQRVQWNLVTKSDHPAQRRRNDKLDRSAQALGHPNDQASARLAGNVARRLLRTLTEKRGIHQGVDLMCRCGQWLWDVGSRDEAVATFEEVIRLAPTNVRAHNNLGVAFWRLGDRASAVRHFRVARDLDPSDRDTTWNCGQIMVEVGELVSARFLFESFLRQFGPDQDIATALVDLSLIARTGGAVGHPLAPTACR